MGYDPYQNGMSNPQMPAAAREAMLRYLNDPNFGINGQGHPAGVTNDFPKLGTGVTQVPGANALAPPTTVPAPIPAAPTAPTTSVFTPPTSTSLTHTNFDPNATQPGSNRAVNGVVPSTADHTNWGGHSTQQQKLATPEQLATLTPHQRELYDMASKSTSVPDPLWYALHSEEAIADTQKKAEERGNRTQGGSFFESIYGPPPKGWVYNSNGGLMKESGWDKFDKVMSAVTIAGLTGGTGLDVAAAGGGAIADVAHTAAIGNDDRFSPEQRARAAAAAAGADASTGTPSSTTGTGTGTGTSTTAAPAGGIAVPDNADTNGFAKPGYAVTGSPQAPPGWDQTKWANTAHQSPKYAVGRILSQYPQTTGGLTQAMPEIEKAYPGAKQTGEDTISVPGVGEIDVVKAGGGFWWGPETDANGNPYPKDTGGQGVGDDSSGGYNAAGNPETSDVIAKIVARLGAMAGGQGKGAGIMSARDALLKQFGAR